MTHNDHGFLPAVEFKKSSGRAPQLIQFILGQGQQGADLRRIILGRSHSRPK
jgi:hypothetical protein